MQIKDKIKNIQIKNFKINHHSKLSSEKYYNTFLISFTLLLSIYIISCDKIILNDNTNFKNANYIEKNYNFEDKFENIIINGNFEIEFVKSDSQYVRVENFIENSFSQIRPSIYLQNGNLIINELHNKIENKNINFIKFNDCNNINNNNQNKIKQSKDEEDNHNIKNKPKNIKLIIYTDIIHKLKVFGNSKVYSNEIFKLDSINCDIYGNSFIHFNINSNNLNIQSNGNSCFVFKGKVKSLNMDIVGNENIQLDELKIINSDIKVAGNSTVTLKVDDKLKAEILGNPKIILINNPKIIESDITGNGFIRK